MVGIRGVVGVVVVGRGKGVVGGVGRRERVGLGQCQRYLWIKGVKSCLGKVKATVSTKNSYFEALVVKACSNKDSSKVLQLRPHFRNPKTSFKHFELVGFHLYPVVQHYFSLVFVKIVKKCYSYLEIQNYQPAYFEKTVSNDDPDVF